MIFKHNKNISRNFIAYLISIFFIISCGGGGGSSEPQANLLTFSLTGLPPSVRSYENVTIRVQPSIQGCKFEVLGPDLLWLSSSDELSFTFRAPIIYTASKEFSFGVRPVNTNVKPECAGSQNFTFNVTRNPTKFIPNPEPSNISYLSSLYFSAHDIGFGGIEITDRYSATFVTQQQNDCVTYENEFLVKMLTIWRLVIFNGMDLKILWLHGLFFLTPLDQSKKIYGPLISI